MEEKPKFERPTNLEEEHALTLERSKYMLEHIAEQDEKLGIDFLTGLRKREILEHELDRSLRIIRGEIVEKRGEPLEEVSLISVDVDHFKEVNDTYGHAAGDEVLKKIATLLMHSIRETDIAARMGGEELMVLLRGAGVQVAARHAEELREKIEGLAFDDYPELKITASFGVISSENSTDAKVLHEHVDKALYAAKHGGRNRIEVYHRA